MLAQKSNRSDDDNDLSTRESSLPKRRSAAGRERVQIELSVDDCRIIDYVKERIAFLKSDASIVRLAVYEADKNIEYLPVVGSTGKTLSEQPAREQGSYVNFWTNQIWIAQLSGLQERWGGVSRTEAIVRSLRELVPYADKQKMMWEKLSALARSVSYD